MQRTIRTRATALTCLLIAGSIAAAPSPMAAAPPDAVHYQAVLRDGDGNPRDGSFDMVFRFFDAEAGGNEILVDAHLAAGSGDVTVSDGLMAVALGSGEVSDGAVVLPGDPFDALGKAFGAFDEIWMQIEIDSGGLEVLSPRVRVLSAPYALNATTLGGMPAGGFIDLSPEAQTSARLR